MAPDFSIAVPTAGDSERLSACLHSLLEQSGLGSTRIIVVDNGDGKVRENLSRLLFPEQGIEIVREARRGVGSARNAGLRAASTDWVIFTDDDCVVPTNWLDQIRDFLISNPDLHIAGGLVDEPDRRGAIYSFMSRLNHMKSKATLKRRHADLPSLGGANLACRREAILAIGGFDESLVSTEDYELLVRAHAYGLRISLYADVPAVSHRHETDLRRFVGRYCAYGFGVGQTLRKHRHLNRIHHRVYVRRGSPLSIVKGALQFAREDLSAIRGSRRWSDVPLSFLRAVAFQYGAWKALG